MQQGLHRSFSGIKPFHGTAQAHIIEPVDPDFSTCSVSELNLHHQFYLRAHRHSRSWAAPLDE